MPFFFNRGFWSKKLVTKKWPLFVIFHPFLVFSKKGTQKGDSREIPEVDFFAFLN
jgi:hypothetical protein